jgi:hypothetical protein
MKIPHPLFHRIIRASCLLLASLSLLSPFGALNALNAAPTSEGQKDLNILFLGNSFTDRHHLDQLVKQLFEVGHPELNVHAERVIYGGQNMYKHKSFYFSQSFIEQSILTDEVIQARIDQMEALLEQETAPEGWVEFHKVIRPNRPEEFSIIHRHIRYAIKRHKNLLKNNPKTEWDYVVLQSWVDVHPSLDEGYAKYAIELAEIAKAQGAEVILYVTAPKNQNATPVSEPQGLAQSDLELKLAKALEKEIGAFAVVPMALAINKIQEGGTELTFRYENDFHPNQTTAFLAANMFYAAFFGESPEGLDWDTVTETKLKEGKDPDGGHPTVVFDPATKTYLQKMAYESIMAYREMP